MLERSPEAQSRKDYLTLIRIVTSHEQRRLHGTVQEDAAPAAVIDAVCIDVHHGLEAFRRELLRRRQEVACCAIDQRVQRTKPVGAAVLLRSCVRQRGREDSRPTGRAETRIGLRGTD